MEMALEGDEKQAIVGAGGTAILTTVPCEPRSIDNYLFIISPEYA
jgi:hypothetical protein